MFKPTPDLCVQDIRGARISVEISKVTYEYSWRLQSQCSARHWFKSEDRGAVCNRLIGMSENCCGVIELPLSCNNSVDGGAMHVRNGQKKDCLRDNNTRP